MLDWLYTYAWFVTFGLSFGLYTVLMKAARPLVEARTHA
jgi:cytosine/uracil/thiamine/allantoin permease